jgi:hypothetical protein
MQDTQPGTTEPPVDAPAAPEDAAASEDALAALRADVAVLIEDVRTYAEAEVAFQKTRAQITGKTAGRALALLVVALVLLHAALIALAVGAVIALAPLLGAWSAVGLVVGLLLVAVIVLVLAARRDGALLAALFAKPTGGDAA